MEPLKIYMETYVILECVFINVSIPHLHMTCQVLTKQVLLNRLYSKTFFIIFERLKAIEKPFKILVHPF